MSNLATIVNNILADSGIDDINVVVTTGSYANPAWITSLAWSKITGAPANIVTGTGAAGQVAFFNGTTTIGSEINLLWDSSNNRLGIGVTPTQALDVVGKIKATDDLVLAQQNPAITFDNGVSGTLRIFSSFAAAAIATFNSTGGFTLNQYGTGARTGTRAYDLAVDASGNVIEVAVGAGTITGGGTAGQVSYFNGSSSITSDANFTWDSSTETLAVEENISSYRRYNLYFNDTRNLAAQLYEDGASTNGGTLTLYSKATNTISTVISAAPTKLNYINNAANVMIGWNTDQGYKLAVNGDFYTALDATVAGKVGIGIAPISGVSLYIKGASVDSPIIRMDGLNHTVAILGDTTTGTTDVGSLLLYNESTLRLRLSSNTGDESFINAGNFVIGSNTGSGYKVEIFHSNEDALRIHNTTTTGDALIAFTNADAGFLARIQGFDGGGLQFDVGNGAGGLISNALRIANTGQATFISHVNSGGWFAAPNDYGLTALNAAGTAGRVLIKLNASNQIEIGRDSDISQIRMGTAASTDAFTMLSNGNVGLGFTNPSQRLQVSGRIRVSTDSANGGDLAVNDGGLALSAIGSAPIQFWRNNYANLSLNINSSGISTFFNTVLINSDSDILRFGNLLRWGFQRPSSDNRYVSFVRNANATAVPVWTVDGDNGNVGIGTLLPTGKLMIEATGNHLFLRASSATAGKYWNFDVTSANQLYIINNAGSQYLTILDGGNTGIGASSPSYRLDVIGNIRALTASSGVSPRTDLGGTIIAEGSTRAGLYILTSGTAAGSYGSIWWGNGNTNTDAYISVQNDTRAMDFGTADGFRMRITASGPVVIGGTTPINAASGRGNLTINGSTTSILNLSIGNGERAYLYHSGTGMQLWNVANGDIEVGANNSPVGYFKAVSSGSRAFVVGEPTALATSTNRANITINGGSNSILAFGVNNNLKGYLYNNNVNFIMNHGTGDFIFETDTATPMTITSGGLVGIRTTPTVQFAVNGSSNGIDFETNVTPASATTPYFTIRESGVSRTVIGYNYETTQPLAMVITQTANTTLGLWRASDNTSGATLRGMKSRGTAANPGSVANGDTVFAVEGYAWHGSGPNHPKFGAGMRFVKDDAFGTANTFAPQRTEFYNAVNTTTVQTNMIIFPNGNTTIGSAAYYGSYKLAVEGVCASNSGFLLSSGQYNSVADVPYTGIYMTASASSDGFGALLIASRTDAARPIIFGTNNGSNNGERFRIAASGAVTATSSITATAFFESSDSRIKTLLDNNVDYSLIANVVARYYEKNGIEELGYFAQDFEQILPSAVYKDDKGLLNLSYTQVHTAKIAALEKEVRELKEQLKNK